MALIVELKLIEIPNALEGNNTQKIIQEESRRGVNTADVLVRNKMVQESPVSLGLLRSSWITQPAITAGNITRGQVSSSNVAATVIDKGAKPHFPPAGPTRDPALGAWIRRTLNITGDRKVRKTAFRIGKDFSKRPRRAKRTFTKAFFRLVPQITAVMNNMVDRIVQRLSK